MGKYLVFSPDNELMDKYKEIWKEVKNEIGTINGNKELEYKQDFVETKFDSDDDFLLNRQ